MDKPAPQWWSLSAGAPVDQIKGPTMTAVEPSAQIQQLIAKASTCDGSSLYLAVLKDGGYAVLKSGIVVVSFGSGEEAANRAVDAFERLRLG
jgi:hypothetical protein